MIIFENCVSPSVRVTFFFRWWNTFHNHVRLPDPLYNEDGLFVLRAVLYRIGVSALHRVWCPSTFKAQISSGNQKTACPLWEQRTAYMLPNALCFSHQLPDEPLKMSDPLPKQYGISENLIHFWPCFIFLIKYLFFPQIAKSQLPLRVARNLHFTGSFLEPNFPFFTILWGKYEKTDTWRVGHALKAQLFSDKSIFQPQDIWLLCLCPYVYLKELPTLLSIIMRLFFKLVKQRSFFKSKKRIETGIHVLLPWNAGI